MMPHLVDLLFKAHLERDSDNVLNVEIYIAVKLRAKGYDRTMGFSPASNADDNRRKLSSQPEDPPNPF